MTDKQLLRLYKRINSRFYDGALPKDCNVHFGKTDDCDGETYNTSEVIISSKLKHSTTMVEIVLLHETVHLAMPEYVGDPDNDNVHGMRFQAGIDSLYKKGAYDGLLMFLLALITFRSLFA